MVRLTSSAAFTARSAAYDLLARFFRSGLTEELRDELAVLPVVQDVLPDSIDADSLAADHHGLLGMDVLPYASTYLEADGRPGGATTDYMSRLLLDVGEPIARAEAPDHVSSVLDVLSALCGRQAAASSEEVGVTGAQRELLDHFLSWLPIFQHALSGSGNVLYAAMSDLAMQVVSDHARAIPGEEYHASVFLLPESPDLLKRESTGLRQLADFLVRPALSGMVLTRSSIVKMARELGLPRGFGDRALMLGNLLGSAATYDVVAELVERIKREARDWQDYFDVLTKGDVRAVSAVASIWRRQVGGTLAMLDEIEVRVSGMEEFG